MLHADDAYLHIERFPAHQPQKPEEIHLRWLEKFPICPRDHHFLYKQVSYGEDMYSRFRKQTDYFQLLMHAGIAVD